MNCMQCSRTVPLRLRTLSCACQRGEHHVGRVDGVDVVGREGGPLPGLHHRQAVRVLAQHHRLQHRLHGLLAHVPVAPEQVKQPSWVLFSTLLRRQHSGVSNPSECGVQWPWSL